MCGKAPLLSLERERRKHSIFLIFRQKVLRSSLRRRRLGHQSVRFWSPGGELARNARSFHLVVERKYHRKERDTHTERERKLNAFIFPQRLCLMDETQPSRETERKNTVEQGNKVTYYDGHGSLDELDEEKLLRESTFPIKPDDLVALTKRILNDCILAPEPHLKFGRYSLRILNTGVPSSARWIRFFLDYLKVLKLNEAFPDYQIRAGGFPS